MDKTTIIVVDDSPFASKQIKDLVEENGYEVIGYAKSGEEGIKMYEELHPDIVILDIIMPGIDGIETAEILEKSDPDVTILMLSSLCDTGTLEEVRAIGVKYLIPKPWEDDVLLATLELLKKHKEENKKEDNN
ncbi:MAG: response regulator [Christensenellales bacterium]|jgi:two-component system chemotaxis response regulator CheY|nr:response regulator receiver protein [Clostridium sp. CAG:253]